MVISSPLWHLRWWAEVCKSSSHKSMMDTPYFRTETGIPVIRTRELCLSRGRQIALSMYSFSFQYSEKLRFQWHNCASGNHTSSLWKSGIRKTADGDIITQNSILELTSRRRDLLSGRDVVITHGICESRGKKRGETWHLNRQTSAG